MQKCSPPVQKWQIPKLASHTLKGSQAQFSIERSCGVVTDGCFAHDTNATDAF